MKVTTTQLTIEEFIQLYSTVLSYLHQSDDDAKAKFEATLRAKYYLDLTFIGNYDSIQQFKDIFRWHIQNNHLKYYGYFDEIKDGLLFNMKDGYIENNTKTSEHKSRHIGENSPITSGESFTIDTPSSKSKSEIDNNDNAKRTKTDLDDAFDILKLSNGLSAWAFFEFFINLGFEEYHRLY